MISTNPFFTQKPKYSRRRSFFICVGRSLFRGGFPFSSEWFSESSEESKQLWCFNFVGLRCSPMKDSTCWVSSSWILWNMSTGSTSTFWIKDKKSTLSFLITAKTDSTRKCSWTILTSFSSSFAFSSLLPFSVSSDISLRNRVQTEQSKRLHFCFRCFSSFVCTFWFPLCRICVSWSKWERLRTFTTGFPSPFIWSFSWALSPLFTSIPINSTISFILSDWRVWRRNTFICKSRRPSSSQLWQCSWALWVSWFWFHRCCSVWKLWRSNRSFWETKTSAQFSDTLRFLCSSRSKFSTSTSKFLSKVGFWQM